MILRLLSLMVTLTLVPIGSANASCYRSAEAFINIEFQDLARKIAHEPRFLGAFSKGGTDILVIDGSGDRQKGLQNMFNIVKDSGTTLFKDQETSMEQDVSNRRMAKTICLGTACVFSATLFIQKTTGVDSVIPILSGIGTLISALFYGALPILRTRQAMTRIENYGEQHDSLVAFGEITEILPTSTGVYYVLVDEPGKDLETIREKGFTSVVEPKPIQEEETPDVETNESESTFDSLSYTLHLRNLGLTERPATRKELERVYRRLAARYHGDLTNHNPSVLAGINNSYDALRKTYPE